MTAEPCILLIEDERFIRESLAEFLRDEGYQVIEAESGEEALRFCSAHPFTHFIVDIRLTGIDGIQTIATIKGRNPQARVLVFTGSLEFQISDDLARLGLCHEHIVYKPIHDFSLLLDKLKKL